MNKNHPIYKTTFIDDMRSLVEESAQNFPDSIAISYKENYWDKEVRNLGTTGKGKGVKLRDTEFQKNTSGTNAVSLQIVIFFHFRK